MHSRNNMWVDEEEANPNPKTSSLLGGEEGHKKKYIHTAYFVRRGEAMGKKALIFRCDGMKHVCGFRERFLNLCRWVGNVDAKEMEKGSGG